MSEFADWEFYNLPYIHEDKTIETVAHVWEHAEEFDAIAFIASASAEVEKLDAALRSSARIVFSATLDRDDCETRKIWLRYRRPATEREIRIDRAKQARSLEKDRAWLQQRLVMLVEDAERAGLSAADVGVVVSGDDFSFTAPKELKNDE
ncbi:hypothetical protein G6L37_05480 [Agrobacterium rubi]|nr:hypothetical protein [Agrobacterium rubi]NTF24809.1 hypothetical protein [Agrobacterium rubi]